MELPIDSISPNPQQPRKDFDDKALHDLSASLKQSGVLQPVVVRRLGDGYQLVVGERRWRAAKLAGLTRIPAIVREASDAESLELALVENLLREDLNPMEEAEAYQRLLAEFGWTQEELAQRVARDRSSIANCLRLLKLPDVIQADLRARSAHDGPRARAALARLPCRAAQAPRGDPRPFVVGAHDGARRPGQAHAADAPAASPLGGADRGRGRAPRGARHAGALVGTERAGRIEISYSSREELDRLTELIIDARRA